MSLFLDSNVLVDIFSQDPSWSAWSGSQIEPFAGKLGRLLINGVVYAEVSVGFSDRESFDRELRDLGIAMRDPSINALFRAGKAFREYRQRSATRSTILPDFIIGAHAAELGAPLVTRDPRRYRTYFPDLDLITP